jgi:pimeloyl-ACP methyl ester carboxylesterase
MTLHERIRAAEAALFTTTGIDVTETFLELRSSGRRVRLLACGQGPPVVLLHGVSLSAAAWAPLFAALPGHRLLAIDLPGHGLSDAADYRRGEVRRAARELLDDVFEALGLEQPRVIGHSLGGMFARWHAAADPGRISSLIAVGEPAVALPGAVVRMPLSLLTLGGLGRGALRAPSPAFAYRALLAQGLGRAEVTAAPDALIDALRHAARRPENARTVASLMHAINRPRRPRAETVLTAAELAAITAPTTFIWGADAPYLSAGDARPSIDLMPNARLHVVQGAHGPWLADLDRTASLIRAHLEPAFARAA